jgi:hypothetical protein
MLRPDRRTAYQWIFPAKTRSAISTLGEFSCTFQAAEVPMLFFDVFHMGVAESGQRQIGEHFTFARHSPTYQNNQP